ncbi:MAG: DUF4129 domain-containing protein [Longimicrobiales bacterium]|nr:DUF4129 domain-containing protein [Longimicrobiales bacterium]
MPLQLPDDETVRAVFQDVLAGPDFEPARMSLAERFVRFVFDILDRIFGDWLPTLDEGTTRVIALILVAVVVGTLVSMVWRRTGDTGRRRDGGQVRAKAGPRTPREWVELARDARSRGDLRGAATGLYQAVVLHLEGRGALRYGEWKTPGDYALEAQGGDAAGPFESFLALFVEVAFGPDDPTDDALESLFHRARGVGCPT